MRGLVLPAICALPAIALQDRVHRFDDGRFVRARHQLNDDIRERAFEVIGGGERGLWHPHDAEAPLVRHQVPWPDGVDELGRQCDAADAYRPHGAVDEHVDPLARPHRMRLGEALADNGLGCRAGLGHAPLAQVEPVQHRRMMVGQGDQHHGCRLRHRPRCRASAILTMRGSTATTPSIASIEAVIDSGARVTLAKMSAKRLRLVISGARVMERLVRPDAQDQR